MRPTSISRFPSSSDWRSAWRVDNVLIRPRVAFTLVPSETGESAQNCVRRKLILVVQGRGRSHGIELHRDDLVRRPQHQINNPLEVWDHGQAPCAQVEHIIEQRLEDIARRIAELSSLREQLAELRTLLPAGTPTVSPRVCCALEMLNGAAAETKGPRR
ncbi:MAG: MerR family DNA-binding protein [Candidatus Xenobia bacterium]